jgi:hypothetical protein
MRKRCGNVARTLFLPSVAREHPLGKARFRLGDSDAEDFGGDGRGWRGASDLPWCRSPPRSRAVSTCLVHPPAAPTVARRGHVSHEVRPRSHPPSGSPIHTTRSYGTRSTAIEDTQGGFERLPELPPLSPRFRSSFASVRHRVVPSVLLMTTRWTLERIRGRQRLSPGGGW